ncbi:MAG TPA: flagellar assembly protein FliW [Pirellulales bacterium]|nr:flagellar assembly protein FliW [Pirellulales bacterium]
MWINTTRFGRLEVGANDRLLFPAGILGLEDCREWVLLADAENDALGWLQSTARREIAVAVISPRRFVAGYQLRVSRSELAPLELTEPRQAQVLVIVGKNEGTITLNLKAPLVVNLQRHLGRQVIANNDYPIQYELNVTRRLLKTA